MENTNTAKITTPGDREIEIERVFDAPLDLVWHAFTDPALLAQWWGRGNKVDVVHYEFEPGGRWRFVEYADEGIAGFEGRFREIAPGEHIEQTFAWDGMPGYISMDTAEFEDLGDGRTKVRTLSRFFTTGDRDGMLASGMAEGLNQSYATLDRLLASAE